MISTQGALPRRECEGLFADVIVQRHLAGPFTYTVPLSLRPTLRVGHRVFVPFGRSILQGAVVALFHVLPHGLDRARLKEIRSLLPEGTASDVPSNLFELSRHVAEQYIAPWGQCLRLVLPPTAEPRTRVSHYELTVQGRAALVNRETCSEKARALLTRLGRKPPGLRRSSRSPGPANLLHDLKARGWVMEVQGQDLPFFLTGPIALPSRPANQGNSSIAAPLNPDPAMAWADPLFAALRAQGPSRVLLQSPWTDRLGLLQQAVRLVLDRGQTVLIIVGEAERAQWVASLIRDDERGISPVCFHSGLSALTKLEIWDQIHRQIVRVVVGTRSDSLTDPAPMQCQQENDAHLRASTERN